MSSPCVYPLTDTSHKPFITIQGYPCGLYCGNNENPPLFFTGTESAYIQKLIFGFSICLIFVTILYFYIVHRELIKKKKSFCSLPIARQSPSYIAAGYFLTGLSSISASVFGGDNIICNSDDNSLVWDGLYNLPCSFTAFCVWLGIRMALLYSSALSISLLSMLYYPLQKQWNYFYHLVIVGVILVLFVPLALENHVTGDYYFGICTIGLARKTTLLWMEIVPISCIASVFTIAHTLSAWKLFRWRRAAGKEKDRNNEWSMTLLLMKVELKSLQKRILWYNFLQTIAVIGILANFWYWYINIEKWETAIHSVLTCAMNKTSLEETNYDACLTEQEGMSRPFIFSYCIFPACALVSIIGALIFQCTTEVKKSIRCVPFAGGIESDDYSCSTGASRFNSFSMMTTSEVELSTTERVT